jgi:RNA polymerase sigma-70 factor (ECF subfamily)
VGVAKGAQTDEAGASRGTTLGDILFADRKPSTPESEWVALVRSIATRNPRALQALYRRTNRIVFTLIMRITHNRQTAEELTLDVFHDVWRRAPAYDAAQGSVVGWVMNQARSRAIDRMRFEQRKKRVGRHPHEACTEDSATTPDEALEFEEQGRQLRGALGALTPEEREAIEVAFFSGLTHAETAARLGQPLGTVKTRIRSGLDKLRHALAEETKP